MCIICRSKFVFYSLSELARQAESAKLLEDKVRRAESEYHEMEQAKLQIERERKHLEEEAMREKQESESSRKKAKDMEEKARRMAAEAAAKNEEILAMQAQVRMPKLYIYHNVSIGIYNPHVVLSDFV